jgi:MFS family permease
MKKLTDIFADPRAPWFLVIMVTFGIGSGVFGGVFNNYLHDVLKIGKIDRGIIELPREAPGLLLLVLIAILYRLSEIKILRLALCASFIGVVGIALTGTTRVAAIGMVIFWSLGEHLMMPIRDTIAMHMAKEGKTGIALGTLSSAGNIGLIIGYFIVPIIVLLLPTQVPLQATFPFYRMTFFIAGGLVFLAVLASFRLIETPRHVQRERLLFHRRYTRYFILEVFFGGRKQVFITFAPYVLILIYGAQAKTLSLLFGVAAILGIFVGPAFGKIIDKFGYRTLIMTEAIVQIILCIVYGFAHRVLPHQIAFYAICAMFIIDSLMFAAGMARSMYARSIAASHDEFTAALSTGISINHLISIIIAVSGGIIWATLGVETLFCIAAGIACLYLIFAFGLPQRHKAF